MTVTQNYGNIIPSTPILSADPNVKEDVMTDQQKITIFYCRLSNEDSQDGESNSIQNQRELLTRYAQDHGYTNLKVLVDDGYTGTNFQRPGVQEGFELVKQGLVGCWLCKDLSRFGRDYLTVGQYTDTIFPSYDVRFIAVNDGVDSQRGDGEGFAAVRNLFNEWYPRDTSKKVRISLHQRGTSGKHLGKLLRRGLLKPDVGDLGQKPLGGHYQRGEYLTFTYILFPQCYGKVVVLAVGGGHLTEMDKAHSPVQLIPHSLLAHGVAGNAVHDCTERAFYRFQFLVGFLCHQ